MLDKRFYQQSVSFVITEVFRGIRECGKHKDRCDDPEEDQDMIILLCFTIIEIKLCGKQASHRPVSTTVGDYVGIPVAQLLYRYSFIALFTFIVG